MLLSVCNEITATFGRLLAYAGVIALLGALAAKMLGVPEVEAAVEPSARPQWVAIERPHPAFALVVPEFAEASYAIHRHRGGHGRKDIMVWGEPDSPGARLMVEIYRPGAELARFGDPLREVSARAVELGNTSDFALAEPIDSKFGRVALVDFRSKREGHARHCLGFARAFDEPLMQIAGWYCKANDEIIDHNTVACALDRLSVIAAGSDPKVSALFANAELGRKFCRLQKPALRGSTLRRLDWIEAARTPKLRGRQVTR
jgi:hypothetical protein